MKLEINYRKKTGEKMKIYATRQHAPKQPMRIKEEIKQNKKLS